MSELSSKARAYLSRAQGLAQEVTVRQPATVALAHMLATISIAASLADLVELMAPASPAKEAALPTSYAGWGNE